MFVNHKRCYKKIKFYVSCNIKFILCIIEDDNDGSSDGLTHGSTSSLALHKSGLYTGGQVNNTFYKIY